LSSAPTLETLPPLREVIAGFGLAARKGLGQHFLLDLNLTRRIVALAGDLDGRTVFEVGPGPGGLTRPLLASTARKVIAIEKDPRCVLALESLSVVCGERFELLGADALTIEWEKLAPAPRVVVANLPYNVGTMLLISWLKQIDLFESLTLMFQAEVVDRLLAKPGTKAYGRLSILTQFFCEGKRVMKLPAQAFTPPPKVESAVVRLTPRAARPPDVPFSALETVTAAAFGQRRKMLRSSLKPLGGEELLAKVGIDPTARAEELPLSAFEDLARAL